MSDLSVDLRRRVVQAYRANRSGTYAETAALFGIGEATLSRLLRTYRETGDVLAKRRGGNNPRRVDLAWLRQHLQAHPDARIVDRIAAWKREGGRPVGHTAMWMAIRACGWTAKLVFLDESGFRLGSPPNYGWAPLGDKSPGKATHGNWSTMTMIGAVALDGWRGFVTIDAATDGDVFLAFVEQELAPNLRAGDVVVMDNLSAHKRPDATAAIRAAGADVLFLPPYSPEYNPIEKAWAKLKDILRRAATLTRDLFDTAVARAMNAISRRDIRGWTQHAGYSLGST